MTKIPLIMDCDPGLDDAVAILLALASPEELDVLGITTVVGNCPVEQSQQNVRRICELTGRTDMKVYQGCPRTMFSLGFRPSFTDYVGADIHGETGLGGCKLPAPTMPLQPQNAVSYLIETLLNSPVKITIAASGCLTNLACAFIMEPRIKEQIEKLVIMGGSIGLGNMSPAAEFNFYTEPQAAYVVFTSGVPIVMLGLDVTRQTQTSEKWLGEIEAMGTPVSQAVVDMMSYYHRPDAFLEPGVGGGVLHDPNIIAYLIKPQLYRGREAYVEVDISSTVLAGRTTVDWHGKLNHKPTAYVINEVDADGFFTLLAERLRRYPPQNQE